MLSVSPDDVKKDEDKQIKKGEYKPCIGGKKNGLNITLGLPKKLMKQAA